MDRYNVLLFFFVQESAGRFQRIWKLFWPGSATIVPFRIPGKRSVLFSERRFLFAGTFRSTPALSFRQPFSFGPCVWGHHLFQMTSTLALVPFLAHILLFSSAVLLYVAHVLWLTLYQALERNGAQTALCLFWFPLNCVSFRTGTPFFKISLKWIFSLFLCGCESADHKVLRFWFVHWTHPPFWSKFCFRSLAISSRSSFPGSFSGLPFFPLHRLFSVTFLGRGLPVFTFHTLPTVFSRYFSLLLFSFLVGEQVWIFLDTSGFAKPPWRCSRSFGLLLSSGTIITETGAVVNRYFALF